MNRQHEPLLSIVTVTLNCAADALCTAASVREQRFDDYEYLVKDGGSTDGTVEQLRALGVRVEVIADSGVYAAMNQALALCRGRYVCFMNAGDRFAGPPVLAAVAEAIRRHASPDLLYGDLRSFSGHPLVEAGVAQADQGREICYPNRLRRFYLFRKMVCHQAWFVRRDVYLALNGLDERYLLLADYAFLLRLAARPRARLAHLPQPVAVFQGGGASERSAERHAAERRHILSWAFSPLERAVYGAAYYGARGLVHDLLYRRLYPILPGAARRRINGM